MAVAFKVPQVAENLDAWGPDSSSVPSQLEHVPDAPFSKGASDWTGQAFKYNQGRFDRNNAGGASVFNLDSFHLVDTRPPPRPKYGGRRFQQRFQRRDRDEGKRDGGRDSGAGADRERRRRERLQQQKRGQWNAYWQDKNAPRIVYNSSVDIRPEWAVLEQIPLTSLSKLSYEVGEPEDITTCGTLEYYDKSFDRLTPKTEKPLERFENRNFYKVTTTDDLVIRDLLDAVQMTGAKQGAKPTEVYGFVGAISTLVGFVVFLVWAYLPEPWLHSMGITYYPNRYWAMAIPAYVLVAIVFVVLFYTSLNYMATPSPCSFDALFDEYTRGPFCNNSQLLHEVDRPIHAISDVPITIVNALVFGGLER